MGQLVLAGGNMVNMPSMNQAHENETLIELVTVGDELCTI